MTEHDEVKEGKQNKGFRNNRKENDDVYFDGRAIRERIQEDDR